MLITEVRIGRLGCCAVSGPPRGCRREGAEPPRKDEPYLGRQVWWGCRSGTGPRHRKRAELACGEGGAQLTPGGKTNGSEERGQGLKTKPAELAKAWLFCRRKRVNRFPR